MIIKSLASSSSGILRALSSWGSPLSRVAAMTTTAQNTHFTKEDSRAFMSVFPDLVRELTVDDSKARDLPYEVNKRLSKSIQYNVPKGKKTRGLSLLVTYKSLVPESQRTEQELQEAIVMGWCIEFYQASLLVADDIMDRSLMRRQQPCWYTKEEIGVTGFNDSFLLQSCVYRLLRNRFGEKPYYTDVLNTFLEVHRITSLGQSLDLMTTNSENKVDIETFDMKRYTALVKYKTSYYSMYLPVALGMKMRGLYDAELYRQARTILLEIGHYFQVQDDYLDCFGDVETTGKQGTDIQDAKCSWLIVVALQRANPSQKQILKDCYGSADPEKVERVKSIYRDLKIPKIFANYEEDTYKDIETHINQLSGGIQGIKLPPSLFKIFLNKVHKRNK